MKEQKKTTLIGRNPGALTASSTEEIGRIIIKIPSLMKEVLWLGVQQSEVSQSGVSDLYTTYLQHQGATTQTS